MEIAELVLKYVQTLAWPMVTLAGVWVLRGQIRGAFTRVTRLETPVGAIEFSTDARDARQEAEELAALGDQEERQPQQREEEPHPEPEPAADDEQPRPAPPPPPLYTDFRRARYMAEASPVGAVVTASQALERRAAEVLERHPGALGRSFAMRVGRPPMLPELIQGLERAGLSESAVRVMHRLHILRNQAVHDEGTVTPVAALDFVDTCVIIARELDAMP